MFGCFCLGNLVFTQGLILSTFKARHLSIFEDVIFFNFIFLFGVFLEQGWKYMYVYCIFIPCQNTFQVTIIWFCFVSFGILTVLVENSSCFDAHGITVVLYCSTISRQENIYLVLVIILLFSPTNLLPPSPSQLFSVGYWCVELSLGDIFLSPIYLMGFKGNAVGKLGTAACSKLPTIYCCFQKKHIDTEPKNWSYRMWFDIIFTWVCP